MPTCTPAIIQKFGMPEGPSSASPSGVWGMAPRITWRMPSFSNSGTRS